MNIAQWREDDREDVIGLILSVQRAEFGMAITRADQPDLEDVPGFYGAGAGGFWCARIDERLVGTIGLKDIGGGLGVVRKMFVASDYRGRGQGVAHALLAHLVAHATAQGMSALYLGTTPAFTAAHRFYEKNGFNPVAEADLPPAFPRMAVDTLFYRRDLPIEGGHASGPR